jgi:hypothetical protein
MDSYFGLVGWTNFYLLGVRLNVVNEPTNHFTLIFWTMIILTILKLQRSNPIRIFIVLPYPSNGAT